MKRYSVEVCHIYVNEAFSHEHESSLEKYKQLKAELEGEEDSHVVSVMMIDDYNPTFDALNRDDLFKKIGDSGVELDFFVYESDLVKFVPEVLDAVSASVQNEYEKYIDKKGKVPCSFLIAVFYLLRLGFFDEDKSFSVIHSVHNENKSAFFADILYNVLDGKYKNVEDKAELILDAIHPPIDIKEKIHECYY